MLAAGHQAQAEARLVERDVADHERDHRDEHEPVELERADVHEERLFRLDVLDGGGDVVGVGRGIDGLDDDRRRSGAEDVHGGADDGLVRLAVDGGDGQQHGIEHAARDARQNDQQHHHKVGRARRQIPHGERAAQRADDHDALKTEVDDAGMLREAAAQCHEQQDRREQERILQKKDHACSPPFPAAWAALRAFFSSCRAIQLLSTVLKNSTKLHR